MRKTARLAVAVLGVSVLAAGCGRGVVDPPGHRLLGTVEILDRSTVPHSTLATWKHDGGWTVIKPITMSHAAEDHRTRISLGARMWTQGGSEITLTEDGEYSVRYGIPANGDPDDVINMDTSLDLFHGDHVYIFGHHLEGRTGQAEIIFALWHDGHADGETDPITVLVTD
jgi:hypothetical protein